MYNSILSHIFHTNRIKVHLDMQSIKMVSSMHVFSRNTGRCAPAKGEQTKKEKKHGVQRTNPAQQKVRGVFNVTAV